MRLAPGAASLGPLIPRQTNSMITARRYAGSGLISGTVAVTGVPARRRVTLFDHATMFALASTWSDPITGAYTFSGWDRNRKYLIVCDDHTQTYNAAVADWVSVEESS